MPKKRKRGTDIFIAGDSTVTKVHLSAKDMPLARKQSAARGISWQEYIQSILIERIRKPESGVDGTAS